MPTNPEQPIMHDTQPVCTNRMENIERRLDALEKAEWRSELKELTEKVSALSLQFATLNGKIVGAIAVATTIGGAVTFLIQYWVKG